MILLDQEPDSEAMESMPDLGETISSTQVPEVREAQNQRRLYTTFNNVNNHL